jgi:pimeloyl-ACP methyl ester carboxylesterase
MIEPLVFLPAMMCDARMWRLQAEAFAHERAVMIAPTHLGASVGEVAAQVLDAAPRRFALAGLGLGGVVAMEVLRRAPERLTRIALIATVAVAETPQNAAAREAGIVAAKAGRLAEAVRALPAWTSLAPGPMRGRTLDLLNEMAEDLGPDVFVRQSRLLQRRPDQQRALRLSKAPAMIVAGEHDAAYPVKQHKFIADLMPSAWLEVIPGAGHMLPLEAPKALALAIERWLRAPYRLV